MGKKKIMIVDDHRIVREGLKLIFETFEEFEICGEASDGQEALELSIKVSPDLILLDMKMPRMDGMSFLREYTKAKDRVPVVVLTTLKEATLVKEAMSLGAKGYLLKDTNREVLIKTIEEALKGSILLQAEISALAFSKDLVEQVEHSNEDYGLTERELVVLRAITKGSTSRGIAVDMEISERTVKAHLTSIYSKMSVSSRAEAVAVALANRII